MSRNSNNNERKEHVPAIQSTIRPTDAEAPAIDPSSIGGGLPDPEGMQRSIETSRALAFKAGRLMIKHPTNGKVMPAGMFQLEVALMERSSQFQEFASRAATEAVVERPSLEAVA